MSTRRIERPVFIVGCNRSGTTLLFRNLSTHADLWSHYVEAKAIYHRVLGPDGPEGDRRRDASPAGRTALLAALYRRARNKERWRDRRTPLALIPTKLVRPPLSTLRKDPPIRLIEKTPGNCFRIPLLARLFARARFILVVRKPEAVVSSLLEGWKRWSGQEATDPLDYRFTGWHYIKPPGWQQMKNLSLPEIAAFQWIESNRFALRDLEAHAPGRFLMLRHQDQLKRPSETYGRILDFCRLAPSPQVSRSLRNIKTRVFTSGGSKPAAEKWKRLHGPEVDSVRDRLRPVWEMICSRLEGDEHPESAES